MQSEDILKRGRNNLPFSKIREFKRLHYASILKVQFCTNGTESERYSQTIILTCLKTLVLFIVYKAFEFLFLKSMYTSGCGIISIKQNF